MANQTGDGMAWDEGRLPVQPEGWLYRVLPGFLAWLIPPVLSFWARTLTIRKPNFHHLIKVRSQGGVILAVWHGNMAVPVYVMRNQGVVALVSPVWLGEIIAGIVQKLGYGFVRASSNYNTMKDLKSILRTLRENNEFAIMMDGPSGPSQTVQANVVGIASITGKPIILGYAAAEKSFRLPTWDGSEWPYPFTKVSLLISEPIRIRRKLTPEQHEEYKQMIEDQMRQLKIDAEEHLRRNP